MDFAYAYRDGRERLSTLVGTLKEPDLGRQVPLTPAWRVRDVVAHLIGVCEDSVAGRFPDFSDPKGQPDQARARDAWTDAQVRRWQDVPMGDALERWQALATRLEAILIANAAPGEAPSAIQIGAPYDLGCHLHDVRHALGQPGEQEATTTQVSFALARGWLDMRLRRSMLPALRLRAPDREWIVGDGLLETTLAGSRFELFRTITGRRSLEQVRAMDWDGDPNPFLDALSPYPLPEFTVIE